MQYNATKWNTMQQCAVEINTIFSLQWDVSVVQIVGLYITVERRHSPWGTYSNLLAQED